MLVWVHYVKKRSANDVGGNSQHNGDNTADMLIEEVIEVPLKNMGGSICLLEFSNEPSLAGWRHWRILKIIRCYLWLLADLHSSDQDLRWIAQTKNQHLRNAFKLSQINGFVFFS